MIFSIRNTLSTEKMALLLVDFIEQGGDQKRKIYKNIVEKYLKRKICFQTVQALFTTEFSSFSPAAALIARVFLFHLQLTF